MPIGQVVIIMVLAGAAGGFTNFLLAPHGPDSGSNRAAFDETLPWWAYIVVGIVSTFLVPLFLSLAKSELFSQVISTPVGAANSPAIANLFVFVGFCLVAAVSSRVFIETVSQRVIALARQASKVAEEAKRDVERQKSEVEELSEVVAAQDEEIDDAHAPNTTGTMADHAPQLSGQEIKILEALRARPYTRRTLSGISADTRFERGEARALLGALEAKAFARSIPSKKTGNVLYQITSRGAWALSQNPPP